MDGSKQIVEVILLLGGFTLAGMLILTMGYFITRRKASMIVCAVVAGIFVALQVVLQLFLNSAGQAWGGRGGGLWMAVSVLLAIAGAIAIVSLTRKKLRAIHEGRTPDPAKLAAGWMAAYIVASVLMPFLRSGDALSFLTNPIALLVLGSGVAAAVGLWRRARWAWWLALLLCGWQVFNASLSLLAHPLTLISPYGFVMVLAVAVLVVLLRKDVRGIYLN
jgi:hypothetical protein